MIAVFNNRFVFFSAHSHDGGKGGKQALGQVRSKDPKLHQLPSRDGKIVESSTGCMAESLHISRARATSHNSRHAFLGNWGKRNFDVQPKAITIQLPTHHGHMFYCLELHGNQKLGKDQADSNPAPGERPGHEGWGGFSRCILLRSETNKGPPDAPYVS